LSRSIASTGALLVVAGCIGIAGARDETNAPVLKGSAAFGGFDQDRPGLRRLIRPQDLPPVMRSTTAVAQGAARPEGVIPKAPEGFSVALVDSGLTGPRAINLAPNGDIFIAESRANRVRVLRLSGDGKPAVNRIFAGGLRQPFGIAFYPPGPNPEWLYVANSNSIVRFPYRNGDLHAGGSPETIVSDIPSTHHYTRDIRFTPDGSRLLLTVGSGSNDAEDMSRNPPAPDWIGQHALGAVWGPEQGRADLLSYDPDGRNEKAVATGLRNCSGLAIQPMSGQPWCAVNERDALGDNTPFDYATSVREGAFYGWPWYYIGGHRDPRHKGERDDLQDKVTVPDVLFQAHSAPLQMVFYEGNAFPSEYKGSAFVTMHGSWNRALRTGYKVVRILFDASGKPTGEYEDFMTGFVLPDGRVWGRPVGVAVAGDGSLLVTDDAAGTLWRVFYQASLR
jgi:glucose/arabinose dehydrogenase